MIVLCCNCKYYKANRYGDSIYYGYLDCQHLSCFQDQKMDPRNGYIPKLRIARSFVKDHSPDVRYGILGHNNNYDCKYFEQKEVSIWKRIKNLLN